MVAEARHEAVARPRSELACGNAARGVMLVEESFILSLVCLIVGIADYLAPPMTSGSLDENMRPNLYDRARINEYKGMPAIHLHE
jgi:hypothetical protein